jgi:hypothetical protein
MNKEVKMLIEKTLEQVWIGEIEELKEEEKGNEEALQYENVDAKNSNFQAVTSNFLSDIEALANKNIDIIFVGKRMHSGGAIPEAMLHSAPYITKILTNDICAGVDNAYKAISEYNDSGTTRPVKDAQHLVLEMLSLCSKNRIPKIFAGGLLLMCLEIVKGIRV